MESGSLTVTGFEILDANGNKVEYAPLASVTDETEHETKDEEPAADEEDLDEEIEDEEEEEEEVVEEKPAPAPVVRPAARAQVEGPDFKVSSDFAANNPDAIGAPVINEVSEAPWWTWITKALGK
jgi:hypothetical protein